MVLPVCDTQIPLPGAGDAPIGVWHRAELGIVTNQAWPQ